MSSIELIELICKFKFSMDFDFDCNWLPIVNVKQSIVEIESARS